jgi:hypothetical protein
MKSNQPRILDNTDIDDKHVRTFLRWLAVYIMAVVAFTTLCIYEAFAQDINSLIPNTDITTESDHLQIIQIIEKNEAVQTPSMDVDVIPIPVAIDSSAPNYLEMVYYRMVSALHIRAVREGKAPDYYINIFKAQWESEHPTTAGEALRAVRVVEPACPDGFEIYEGSGICNQFPSHVSAEQNYYHSALSTYQCGVALANVKDQVCVDLGDLADGANRGNLWKPVADDVASCSGGTTILLKESLANVTKIEIMNSNKERVNKPDYLGFFEGTRPRFCARRPGKDFGPYSIYIKYRTIDEDFCFKVNNPANRED